MNSLIYVRGFKTPLHVSMLEAKKVIEIRENKSIPNDYLIHLDKFHFEKGDIRAIEEAPDRTKSEQWSKFTTEFYAEERKNYLAQAALSAEAKSEHLDMFTYLYKSVSGTFPSQEIKDRAKRIQLDFFRSNPYRTLCNVDLFKPILPSLTKPDLSSLNNEFGVHLRTYYLRLCERAIFRDMLLAGEVKR